MIQINFFLLYFLYSRTGISFDRSKMQESLKDGVILCELANKISPGIIKNIKKSKIPFMQMENISFFIQAIRKLGVAENDNFSTVDLFEGKNLNQVLTAIESFSRASRKIDTFKGPYIGVKEAEKQSIQVKNPMGYSGTLLESKVRDIKIEGPKIHAPGSVFDYSDTHTSGNSSPKKG